MFRENVTLDGVDVYVYFLLNRYTEHIHIPVHCVVFVCAGTCEHASESSHLVLI